MRFWNHRRNRFAMFPDGILLERFCINCQAAIKRARERDKDYVPCRNCIEMLNSFVGTNDPPAPTVKPPARECPAPWRWEGDSLVDANGEPLMRPYEFGESPETYLIGELMRAAPEMETLLRNPDVTDGTGHKSGYFDPDVPCDNLCPCWKHQVAALLAKLDAARKAGK